MTTPSPPTDDDNLPSHADFVARRRLWTFIIVIVAFSGWLRFEWSQGGITPLFGPLHLAMHDNIGTAGVMTMCAIWFLFMFCYIAEPRWGTAALSFLAIAAWLFFGCFWWTVYV
jgi:hypothetical protein